MLEVNGVARERRGVYTRLMVRSWPLPMEDGMRIAVELVPQIVADASQASLLRHGDRLSGDVVVNCLAELEMGPDVAWVITCDPAKQIDLRYPGEAPPEDTAPQPLDDSAQGTAPAQPAAEAAPAPTLEPPPTTAPTPAPEPFQPPLPPPNPPPPPTGANNVPPPPPLSPAPAPAQRPRERPPLDSPPLQPPDSPTPPPAPPPAPPANPPPRAVLSAVLAAAHAVANPFAQAENPMATSPLYQEPGPASGRAVRARVVSLGVQLLLASPEGAGVAARRTVIVLVPHVGSAPTPASVPPSGRRPSDGPRFMSDSAAP